MRDDLRSRALAAAGTVLLLFSFGCGRANVTTEIRPDGSWTRKVELHAPAPKGNGQNQGMSMDFGPKIEDVFSYPNAAPWKVAKKTEKDEITITAERTLTAG